MTTMLAQRTLPILAAVVAGTCLFAAGMASRSAEKAKPEGPQLAHMVFFTLNDRSEKARETFIASCRKHLTDHEGAVFFAIGTMAEDVNEGAVSVRDFDVALHVVFASKEAEAAYLKHPRHLQFVEENKPLFAKVRVFDSYVQAAK